MNEEFPSNIDYRLLDFFVNGDIIPFSLFMESSEKRSFKRSFVRKSSNLC